MKSSWYTVQYRKVTRGQPLPGSICKVYGNLSGLVDSNEMSELHFYGPSENMIFTGLIENCGQTQMEKEKGGKKMFQVE